MDKNLPLETTADLDLKTEPGGSDTSEPEPMSVKLCCMSGVCPVNTPILTDVGRERNLMHGRVQVDDVRRNFLGVKMSRQPLWETMRGQDTDGRRTGHYKVAIL